MNKLLKAVVAGGVLAGTGAAAYHLLLTDEARANISSLVSRGVTLGKSMAESMGHDEKEAQEAKRASMNRAWIAQQWKNVGY